MAWFLGQSIVFIVLAFLLGLLVGWIIWGRLSRRSGTARSDRALSPANDPVRSPSSADAPTTTTSNLASHPEAVAVAEPEPVAVAEPEPVAVAEPVTEPEPVAEPVAEAEPAATPADTTVDDPRGLSSESRTSPRLPPVPDDQPDGAHQVAPAASTEALAVQDDNLQRVEGIGPKIAAALQDAGIRTFRQLAGSDDATLRTALQAHRLRFAPSLVTWARQAAFLADGDEAGFAELTRRLVAGRDVRRP